MNDRSEQQLLACYAQGRDEAAFGELVRRRMDLVHSVALRLVADPHLAEDVTQAVFVSLAGQADQVSRRLADGTPLSGWLHLTTRNIAAKVVRTEVRRRDREQEAVAMLTRDANADDAVWDRIAPHLDHALAELPEQDREALLWRFFDHLSAREIGARLGTSEDAAQKRVSRALDKLRTVFVARGLAVPATSLGGVLMIHAIQTAPHSVAGTIIPAALVGGSRLVATIPKSALLAGITGKSGLSITQSLVMTTTKNALAATAFALAVGTGIYERYQASVLRDQLSLLRQELDRIERTEDTEKTASASFKRRETLTAARSKSGQESSPGQSRSNLLNALFSPEGEYPAVPSDFLDRWFASGRTNPLDLLAARYAGQNGDLFRLALTNFPNDPRVLLAGDQFNEGPEAQRNRLNRLKAADPDNAMVDYLSASSHLKEGRIGEALIDLVAASGKRRFDDYSRDSNLAVEELYSAAGFSPVEAKAFGTSGTRLPHLTALNGLSKELAKMQQDYITAGNLEGAEDLARMGVQLGQRLSSSGGPHYIVEELTGMTIEAQVLRSLPPDGHYDFVSGTIAERLAQLNQRRAGIKAFSSRDFEGWLRQASDSEIVSYFDRVKVFGEAEALTWLTSRHRVP